MSKKQSSTSVDIDLGLSLNPKVYGGIKHIFLPTVAVIALYTLSQRIAPNYPVIPAENKPYGDFESFFQFYMSQHQDSVCQGLHAIGTAAVITIAVANPSVIYGIVTGIFVGLSVFPFTRGMSNGAVEALAVAIAYSLAVKYCNGSTLARITPLIAYACAWIGHFYFENNTPATFIYPTYSLIGDFRMFYGFVLSMYL